MKVTMEMNQVLTEQGDLLFKYLEQVFKALTTSTDIHMSVVRILSVSLCLVSIAVLWFALLAVGHALVLPAVGYALLLGSFHYCSRSSMFFSYGPRTLVALLILLATSSLAVVPSVLLLQSHFCGRLRFRGSFLASTCTTIWLHPTQLPQHSATS